MAVAKIKSVILVDKRRISPDTLDRILEAPEGGFVEVDPVEMASFMQLIFFVPQMTQMTKEMRDGNPMGRKKKGEDE